MNNKAVLLLEFLLSVTWVIFIIQISVDNGNLEIKFEEDHSKKLFEHSPNLCCYYRQHYHDALCGKDGCVLTEALTGGIPATIVCQKVAKMTDFQCKPNLGLGGYYLEGFHWNCNTCNK